jgi:transposase
MEEEEDSMSQEKRYGPEFKAQMVALVRSGRSIGGLSREFPPSAKTNRSWVEQADLDDGRRTDGLTTPERDELKRLRREVKNLRIEREILGKAAAWFARETDSIPPKGSDS